METQTGPKVVRDAWKWFAVALFCLVLLPPRAPFLSSSDNAAKVRADSDCQHSKYEVVFDPLVMTENRQLVGAGGT